MHGTHDTVNRILDHPDIAAISFVGGDKAGRYIYERAAANGKRVQVGAAARRLRSLHTVKGLQAGTQRVDGPGEGCFCCPTASSP